MGLVPSWCRIGIFQGVGPPVQDGYVQSWESGGEKYIWLTISWCWIEMWIPLEGRMEICGVETLWHLAACWISRQRNGIPMFPPRDLCPRINPQLRQVGTGPDNLGDLGVRCFLSKRGGRWLPPPTPICSHLNEGTTNREMAAAQSLTNRDKGPVWPAC